MKDNTIKPNTLLKVSFIYTIFAMIFGVFYREFTKYVGFSGTTTLAFTHLHLFVLGMFMFMILFLFSIQTNLTKQKRFKTFFAVYNIALPLMIIMLAVRGIVQVLEIPLTSAKTAMISGIAGISHILMLIAILLLFSCFFKVAKSLNNK